MLIYIMDRHLTYHYKYLKYRTKYINGKYIGGSEKQELVNQLLTLTTIIDSKNAKRLHNTPDLINTNLSNIPIYYINLNRSPDRRNWMEGQFQKYGIDGYTRSEGVDGSKLKNLQQGSYTFESNRTIHYQLDPRPQERPISNGELGCTLSHLETIYQAYIDNQELAIIMEDDAYLGFIPLWNNTLHDMCNNLPNRWELLQLFTITKMCNRKILKSGRFIPINSMMSNKIRCASTLAYLINRRGMLRILRAVSILSTGIYHLPNLGVKYIADWYLYKIIENHGYTGTSLVSSYNIDLSSNITGKRDLDKRDIEHLAKSLIIFRYYSEK
jgi:GR25 family glycosyltransferase involved in LPS biosynthesis